MRDHIPGMRCHYCGRQGGPKETLLTRHVSIQHLGRGRAKRIKRTLVATSDPRHQLLSPLSPAPGFAPVTDPSRAPLPIRAR